MRKTFSTNLDKNIVSNFKATCAEEKLDMNYVIETFMDAFSKGRFKVVLQYDRQLEKQAEQAKRAEKTLSKIKKRSSTYQS